MWSEDRRLSLLLGLNMTILQKNGSAASASGSARFVQSARRMVTWSAGVETGTAKPPRRLEKDPRTLLQRMATDNEDIDIDNYCRAIAVGLFMAAAKNTVGHGCPKCQERDSIPPLTSFRRR